MTDIFRRHPAWCVDDHADGNHYGVIECIELEAYPFTTQIGDDQDATHHFGLLAGIEQQSGSGPQVVLTPPDGATEMRLNAIELDDLIDVLTRLSDLLYQHAPFEGPARRERTLSKIAEFVVGSNLTLIKTADGTGAQMTAPPAAPVADPLA